MIGRRLLFFFSLLVGFSSVSGCVVHDGGEPGKEPIWWPSFLIRQAPDPLRPSNPTPVALRTEGPPAGPASDPTEDLYNTAATAPATRPAGPAVPRP